MKKIKTIINDKIIALDFKIDLLKNNALYKICDILNLSDIYIDIFGIYKNRLEFYKILIERNNSLVVSLMDNSGTFSMKASISDIPMIVETLSQLEFDELNIWDAYTDWEEYLKDKACKPFFMFGSVEFKSNSKVYLNYNQHEGNKVELYLDKGYEIEKITNELSKI